MPPITSSHFLQYFAYFKGEPAQEAGVLKLYQQLQAAAPELLRSSADWSQVWHATVEHEPADNDTDSKIVKCAYFSQRDNYRDAYRTCFSSSCAMLLNALKPGVIRSDDDYIRRVFSIGDTTSADVQLRALASYGVKAQFSTSCSKETLISQINKGIPVPCGYLHHGSAAHPSGGGHWCCITGYDKTGVIVNDPWGECNLSNGTFPSTNGSHVHYSDARWTGPRWQADGPGTGWAILAEI